ncbi:hypothetical protein DPMN_112825 [Dreissena polymorpha]|uniref:Uncharacterized protein n=1 Tax=Dreissena polymorpha TaxID=45954 RepID=A0A9D4KH10_DREPO|nr:hypothetical protein DPMN_112825 [Dreissena polymorpha]
MCALRDNRTLSAVSLACQYRLAVVPKRPPMRRLTRPKKHGEQRFSLELVKVNEDETPPDSAEVEEEEVFNFDCEYSFNFK